MQRTGYLAAPSNRAMAAGRDLWARHHDGHSVPVDISLTPIETEDGPLVAAVARDVRQRRESELRLAQCPTSSNARPSR